MPCTLRVSEERMCGEYAHKELKVPPHLGGIDPQLERAGRYLCDHSKVKIEIPVEGLETSEVSKTSEVWNGVTDYCLYRENGEVPALSFVEGLAVV